MNLPRPKRIYPAALAIAGLCSLAGCGPKDGDGNVSREVPDAWEEDGTADKGEGNLDSLPGAVYASAEASPILWRPWSEETRGMARKSHRLMFVVISIPQVQSHPGLVAQLASDPTVVAEINRAYVPVLVDGDAVRELGILTADLCSEIGSGLKLPLAVWMTPDCDPVAWIPLPSSDSGSTISLFKQSHGMVWNMWMEDPSYVAMNSRADQQNRAARMLKRSEEQNFSVNPGEDSLRALRQLTSLYDPISKSFDETGGLFPSGAIDLLSMGVRMEGIPAELREKCKLTLNHLLDDLLASPMFDPLDGGVFSARRGQSWALPEFQRDCATQARIAVSLLDAYEASGNRKALERALGVIEFAESTYRTEGGLFGLSGGSMGGAEDWLWLHEDFKALLSPGELAAWLAVSGASVNGNLPSEVDPNRKYLRANSISFAKAPEEVAAELGADPSSLRAMLVTVREKLLKFRNSRLHPVPGDVSGSATATFRMVTAYAAAYRITGDESFRERAVSSLEKARNAFSDGPRLKSSVADGAPSLLAGRAFVYGLALQAALDVAAVTLDESWILWAGDLSSTTSEIFVQGDALRECPAYADLTGLPIADRAMLFDESSMGLLAMADARLGALGIPSPPLFSKLVAGLPIGSVSSPILHTDLIQAALMRRFGVTCSYGAAAPLELREAIARSPLKGVSRRAASMLGDKAMAPDPAGALILGPGGEIRRIESANDLAVPSLP